MVRKDKINVNKEQRLQVAKVQVLSEIIARANLAGNLGYSYDGERDLYQALGYSRTLTYQNFIAQYLRQDIARAIIDRPVNVSWSGPLSLVESGEGEETGLEKEWRKLERQMQLKSNFMRLDKLTGLGRYGVLLLGLDDIKKQEDFITAVNPGKRKLLYVRPLGESSAKIKSWVQDPSNPRFGKPLVYDIVLLNPEGNESSTIQVHYSRIIHVVESAMENGTEGIPRLQPVFNRLQDLEKLLGGSAEMFWRGARPGYSGELDKDRTMSTTMWADLQDQIDEYENNLRRILVADGLKLNSLTPQISDPKNHVDVQIMMISAETGIPKRILSGSERGELASSQDAAEWIAFVQSRREEFVEPHIIRPFVDRMIEFEILPKANEEYDIEWQDLFAVSEADRVKIGQARAIALKEYCTMPIAAEVVSPEAFFEMFLGLSREKIELIEELNATSILQGQIQEAEERTFEMEMKAKEKPVKKEVNAEARA
jgi:hypothetical protein